MNCTPGVSALGVLFFFIDWLFSEKLFKIYWMVGAPGPSKYERTGEMQMNNYYGYTRTSTTEQHLDRGILEIKEFAEKSGICVKKIYTDQITGKTFSRKSYSRLKGILKEGDRLIITEVDRLGRSKNAILEELYYFKRHGIRLMVLELPTTLIDFGKMNSSLAELMSDTINNILLELFASMAELEMEKNKKRQREGIDAMKQRGEWDKYGRPRKADLTRFRERYEMLQEGILSKNDIMEQLGISKSTFYRYREELEKEN